ncbi:MAG TPA: hypothetical protein VFF11_03490, partial [Candidatus Binatia bacterium]|nr:hypothetical protein [Candidatus Binatia bacterium]
MKNNKMKYLNLTIVTGIAASALCLLSALPAQAQVAWTGGASPDMNWSTGGNWSGSVPPGAADSVVFGDTGTDATQGNVNNVVDAAFASPIASLTYDHTNNFHTTQIAAGQTLTDTGDLTVSGPATDGQIITYASITGGGGALAMTGSSAILSAHNDKSGSGHDSTHGTLDMSGLGMFTANIGQMLSGASGNYRSSGTIYLAETNDITLTASTLAIDIGDAGGNNGGDG